MTELAYTDFRSFIEEAKKISDYRIIEGADWDAEIGALVESTAELVPQPPMLNLANPCWNASTWMAMSAEVKKLAGSATWAEVKVQPAAALLRLMVMYPGVVGDFSCGLVVTWVKVWLTSVGWKMSKLPAPPS